MTLEEKAIKTVCADCGYIKHIKHRTSTCETKCLCFKFYLTGAKENSIQWHDLRKDPNDLPKDTTSLYLVRVYSWDFGLSHLYKKYGMYIPTVCEWSGEYFKALNEMAYSNARNIKSCIAWCEIPQFNSED
ncbi:MAG: hypothetical protein K6E97_03730 [Treponema sp.]|nr:hypothetical protein [Treponema sp.]